MEGNEILNGIDGKRLKYSILKFGLLFSAALFVLAFLVNSLKVLAFAFWAFGLFLIYGLFAAKE